MGERLPVEVIARLVRTKEEKDRVVHQYVVSIKTPDGKRKEFRSSPGLQELGVVKFLRKVDRFTLRLTAQNFVRLRKNFFLAAAEGYELIENNMCDCTAEMIVRQFMGSLEELIDFEYQNFSGQNKWSIPMRPTAPVSDHVTITYTTPRKVLEKTSIPTHDHMFSYSRQGDRVDSQTRGLRAVQQRYVFGGPLAHSNCYPETSTTPKDRMEKLSNFTFIVPVTDRLFREIRVHNSRVFPRNQPIEDYREFVEQEIDKRFSARPDLTKYWAAIEANLRDDVVLALYSMFKIGDKSVLHFEEKNFYSDADWAEPKELHHFAKYFMGVLQQTDAEVDNSYRLLSTPYASSGERIYQMEVQSEQELAEDDELLRGCPLMTTHETEIADRYIPPEERLVYHEGDLMTQKEFKEAEQRVLDLFAPVEFSHTCNHARHAPYQGRKSNHARQEPVQEYNNGASSSQSSRPLTKADLLPEKHSCQKKKTVRAPAPPPAISVSPAEESAPVPPIPARDGQGGRETDGDWVLVQGKRGGSGSGPNSPPGDNSSLDSFDLVSPENVNAVETVPQAAPQAVMEPEEEPEEEEEDEPAPRPQHEVEEEERRQENRRRRKKNRRERIRNETRKTTQRRVAESSPQVGQDPHDMDPNLLNLEEEQLVRDLLNCVQRNMVLEPSNQQQPAMYRQLPLVPQVYPQAVQDEYGDEEDNYVPPIDDLHVPRALDHNRIALYHTMRDYLEDKVHIFEDYPEKERQFLDRYRQFNNIYRTQYEICTLFWYMKHSHKSVRKLCEKYFVHKARAMLNPSFADSEFLAEMDENSWAAEKCSELLTEIDIEHMDADVLTDGLSFIDMKCDILPEGHPFLMAYRAICDKLILQGHEQKVFYQVLNRFFSNGL